MDENLIYYGAEVKALGEGKVGGYLVRFGDPHNTDLEQDFFTKDTDFGVIGNKVPVYYKHGLDSKLKNRRIGEGETKWDEIGVWFEAQLEMRDEYERKIYELAEQGKLGWSSGAAGHLVEREQIGKSWYVKSWVIAEASLTPTPAEPRNNVLPIKSIYDKELSAMEDTIKNEAPQVDIEAIALKSAEEAFKKFEAAMPKVTAGFIEEVKKMEVKDEVDKAPDMTDQEFFKAVYMAAVRPHEVDRRLYASQEATIKALKANGLNEAVPSEGGFVVPIQTSAGIYQNMWREGSLLALLSPINVSGNNLTINAIDETSRANGSRMGGVRGYWLEEAGTKTASKPKFRQIQMKLKKVAAAVYATDELIEDASALSSWIANNVPNELRFMVEDAIINGDGVGKPLGVINADCLVSAVRTDANEIDSLDVTRMWARRYLGVNDYVWLANASISPQLYNMTLGDQPVYLPPGGFSGNMYGSLMGRPVIETEYNPALGSVGDLLLFSPSQYGMIQKAGGIQAASSIHVQFLTDETVWRFVYRVDGHPLWYSAVTPFQGSDTVSPFVALAATT